jgi:hypothetical protein
MTELPKMGQMAKPNRIMAQNRLLISNCLPLVSLGFDLTMVETEAENIKDVSNN